MCSCRPSNTKGSLSARHRHPSAGLPTELTARGRRQLKVASAAVRRVEQDMLANLDLSEQDQMRRLLTACIASLSEPPASTSLTSMKP